LDWGHNVRRLLFVVPGFVSVLILGVIFLLIWLPSPALAQETPRAALQHRAALTRIAHAGWGLDAPVPLFAAQIQQESGWNPQAVSRVGATGMAQFMPATANWWCALNKLSAIECQPSSPVWAIRSLVGYDRWLYQRVRGESEFDRAWAMLRSYNGGLGHWQIEAAKAGAGAGFDRIAIDAACGRASRSAVHCAENLSYPDRILNRIQPRYAAWGRVLVPI
jgi:soluble lytic murein transglycosylase-like protein